MELERRARTGVMMPGTVWLHDDVQEHIQKVGQADILVGIPSYNNAQTIVHVVRAVKAGCAKYFPAHKVILVNSDGGSSDGTSEVVRQAAIDDYGTLFVNAPLQTIYKIITPYHGLPGKGSALRTVFRIAADLNARACAVVDADLRSITPQWMELLLSPVLKGGFDFVAPLYRRHKYDGTITNSMVYPLTRALYGQRIRQPIGGDFGFSGRLAAHYLTHDVWHTDVARFGIDVWMTTTAICNGFRVCQSFLGAKIHDAKDPGVDLSAMLTQVMSSVFALMENNFEYWATVKGSHEVPLFGFEYTVGLEPVNVNVERMHHYFQTGARDLQDIWRLVLAQETYAEIEALAAVPSVEFHYPPGLWARTVYDFALAWHRKTIDREHLLRSLTPLYLGRTASFVLETANADSTEVERILENLCLEYEKLKPCLLRRWSES